MDVQCIHQHGANHIRTGIYLCNKSKKLWWFFLTEKNNRTPEGKGPFVTLEEVNVSISSTLLAKTRIL